MPKQERPTFRRDDGSGCSRPSEPGNAHVAGGNALREERKAFQRGFTLIEMMVTVAVIGVLAVVVGFQLEEWFANQRAKSAARSAADVFLLARGEAVRTGRNHIVFFGPPGSTDPAGTALTDGAGEVVPLLVLDDGPPATANCRIDAGEAMEFVRSERDVSWGLSAATQRAPDDLGGAPFAPPQASGSTFADPDDNPANWILFRADGVPVAFSYAAGSCDEIGRTGTGGGALYLTNGRRDHAVVLSPLGAARVHLWRPDGAWSG
jgi:prepilin-type N-terminal cleavage/methylation domain-containing protein